MIVVVGSVNVDMVTKSDKFPKIGETIMGSDFQLLPGGKGANQAISISKLGEEVSFIGCLGNDYYKDILIDNFKNNNISTDNIEIVNDSTGVAQITIANNDNSIIVVPGANMKVTREVIDKHIDTLLNANLVLLQLEIPIETVEYIVNICYKNKIKVLLNPAPSKKLSEGLLGKVDYLTPNETELTDLFSNDRDNVLKQYPNKIIVTAGNNGVFYHNGNEVVNIPSEKVKVVDTTGAGDTFNGALAVGLVKGLELGDAIKNANKVASLVVQEVGAQALKEIDYNSVFKIGK